MKLTHGTEGPKKTDIYLLAHHELELDAWVNVCDPLGTTPSEPTGESAEGKSFGPETISDTKITWKEVLATVAVGDVSLPPANPEQTQTEKAPRVGVNLLGLVPLAKKLFKKKSVPLETPKAAPAPSPESPPCAFNPVVFEIEVYDAAGTSLLETHEVRANGACTWHNVSKKLKFAEDRKITVKTKFLDPACSRNAYYDNIRIRIMDIPEVLQQNHYYPFGMNMTGIEEDDQQTLSSLEENMYQYNGKEKDLSLGLHWHDYEARAYDAQLGRWNGVAPLAEKYYSYSSYNYVVNNPINMIDPDGRTGVAVIDEEKKTMAVYTRIIFYGDAASQNLVDHILKDINDQWNRHAGEDGYSETNDGWKIKFHVTGEIIEDEKEAKKEIEKHRDDPIFAFIRIEDDNEKTRVTGSDGVSEPVSGVLGASGFFLSGEVGPGASTAHTPAHEYGHFLGNDQQHYFNDGINAPKNDPNAATRQVTLKDITRVRKYISDNGKSIVSLPWNNSEAVGFVGGDYKVTNYYEKSGAEIRIPSKKTKSK